MSYSIITISRQYGSGGREIGTQLADRLGIPFYDKVLCKEAAKRSGLDPTFLELAERREGRKLAYQLQLPGAPFRRPFQCLHHEPPPTMNSSVTPAAASPKKSATTAAIQRTASAKQSNNARQREIPVRLQSKLHPIRRASCIISPR